MKEQEDKPSPLPLLPRPSPWKEMYHKLIRPSELSVLQQRGDSSSTVSRDRRTKKSGTMKVIRKSKLKVKRRKKKVQKEQQADVLTPTHENDAASSGKVTVTSHPTEPSESHSSRRG